MNQDRLMSYKTIQAKRHSGFSYWQHTLHLLKNWNIKRPLCHILSYTKPIYCSSANEEGSREEQSRTRETPLRTCSFLSLISYKKRSFTVNSKAKNKLGQWVCCFFVLFLICTYLVQEQSRVTHDILLIAVYICG